MSYEEFFHLKDAPFRLTPDPDYFFPSGVHKEALDTMVYSIRSGEGFVMITGTPGVGKTLLVRKLLRELGDKVNLALVLNPTITPKELLAVILDDLALSTMEESQHISKEMLLRRFRDYLLDKSSRNIKTIIIIDEAQNLPKDTLEELRMLSNLESDKEKLLQIILVGQLELEERLQYDEMKQLAQRITIRHRLTPLSPEETGAYVRHRLEVAGDAASVKFMPRVMGRIHALSSGIPRRINLICERALMAAYVDGEKSVSRKHLVRAIKSIEGHEEKISSVPRWLLPALAGALVVMAAFWFGLHYKPEVGNVKLKMENGKLAQSPVSGIQEPASSNVELKMQNAELSQADIQQPASSIQDQAVSNQDQAVNIQQPADSNVELKMQNAELSQADIQHPATSNQDQAVSNQDQAVNIQQPAPSIQNQAVNIQQPASSIQDLAVNIQEPVSSAQHQALEQPLQYLDDKAGPSLLPVNEYYLSVNRDNNLAQLWQGGPSGPLARHRFQLDWRIMEGLYILGHDKEKGAFIFNPVLFQWGGYNMLNAAALWDQVDEYAADPLVPVVVSSGSRKDQEILSSDITTIREMINEWAQAWRDRDITTLMSFYSRSFTSYSIDSTEPETYSLAQLSEIRGRILGTSSYISLTTSTPVILIDPQNPDLAIGVFRQEYNSNTYSDKGVKVLYLRREGNYPERPWKIVAKFFLPKE